MSHDSNGFREAGLSGALSWNPQTDNGRGPSLTLSQTVGARAVGGMDALLEHGALAGLAAKHEADGGLLARRRFETTFGYGFGAFGDRFTSTPEVGFGLSEAGRDYRLGWRLSRSTGAGSALDLALEAVRHETANDNGAGAESRAQGRGTTRREVLNRSGGTGPSRRRGARPGRSLLPQPLPRYLPESTPSRSTSLHRRTLSCLRQSLAPLPSWLRGDLSFVRKGDIIALR